MTTHRVTLSWRDGSGETVRASEDESVLNAAESAGVRLPFGCRTGACASCAGRLREGSLSHDRPPRALRSRDVEAGYVLCCIARPLTDCRIAVGADVRTELVPKPWE